MKSDLEKLDKEVDSLLRHRLQQDVHGSVAFGEQTSSKGVDHQTAAALLHLDADELNAYAENAVPAATRVRYTAHLADCDRCRKIATTLILSLDIASETEQHTAPQRTRPVLSSGERLVDVFKSFFAPRTLGFALPMLLALFGVVIGILLIATRNRHSESLVASHSEEAEIRSVADTNANMNSSVSSTAQMTANTSVNQGETVSLPDAAQATRSTNVSVQQKTLEAPVPEPQKTTSETLSPTSNKPAPAAVAGLSAPPPTAEKSENKAQRVPEVKSDEETARITELPISGRSATQADKDSSASDDDVEAVEARKAGPAKLGTVRESTATPAASAEGQNSDSVSPRRRAASRAMSRAPVAALKQKDESLAGAQSEIRRIGDRQFRRGLNQQPRQWIDTAYKSSMIVINIARGSEPYRALVAGEPELRRIVEQLDGEIILVWKNRAYHIR